jgi:urease beta subunit
MTNTLKLSLFSAAFLALSATSSFAQASGYVTVKVPFEFTAGNVTLPAGDYTFQESHSGVVTISSLSTLKSVMVLSNADTSVQEGSQPHLKFDKENGAYSLTEVDITGEPGRRIVKVETKVETASNRPASIGARASAGATSKSLK